MKFISLLLLATSHVFAAPTSETISVPPMIFTQCTRPGFISLTFDDGPTENVDRLLAVFKKLGTRATFFVNAQNWVDFTDPNSEAAKRLLRVYQAGHQIGTHGFSHQDFATLSREEIEQELSKNDDAIAAIIGQRPRHLRLPYLSTNPTVLQIVTDLGYKVVGVNLDTKDWELNQGTNVAESILESVRPTIRSSDNTTQSFITLNHDFVTDIDVFAEKFTSVGWNNGYRFRTVAQCLDSEPYLNPTKFRNPKDFPTY